MVLEQLVDGNVILLNEDESVEDNDHPVGARTWGDTVMQIDHNSLRTDPAYGLQTKATLFGHYEDNNDNTEFQDEGTVPYSAVPKELTAASTETTTTE